MTAKAILHIWIDYELAKKLDTFTKKKGVSKTGFVTDLIKAAVEIK
jgi:hypothetical protein